MKDGRALDSENAGEIFFFQMVKNNKYKGQERLLAFHSSGINCITNLN